MADFTVHTIYDCPHCKRAKSELEAHGLSYVETIYGTEELKAQFKVENAHLVNANGKITFPQVYDPDGVHIGGADQLEAYLSGYSSDDDF